MALAVKINLASWSQTALTCQIESLTRGRKEID